MPNDFCLIVIIGKFFNNNFTLNALIWANIALFFVDMKKQIVATVL